ncbi:sugar 3,4-ketoisomerase [Algoriphagus boritolerans]|uniref:WxcM-like, C-terminal n=1 Tax=Algoriphagus boritolerans DSM 17298 = JCM 18970 TaxID=1120964 RepID=A0A1H5X8K2_9BACT|nr:FdtA/QdtA family cupin domain-containing protein [Algoriphagus boritolerans]SEG07586.1 WxcM-like, C-terminal [Algoriphagus boritolerans DSM 17298 = JCM 18970]
MSSEALNKIKLSYRAPRLIEIPGHIKENGSVHFWENRELFPQGVLRCFWISGVREGESRGNHAHREESQVIVAVAGKIEIKVDGFGGNVFHFELDKPNVGLFVPPLNWISIQFSSGAVLLGLGDRVFSEKDYIRDRDYFGTLQ